MARKGRDLFEVLRERSAGGSRAASPQRSGARRRGGQPASAGGELAKVGRDVVGFVRKAIGGEPEPPVAAPLARNGLVLAAVAAVALLLGFVVGRGSSAAEPGGEGLRVDAPREELAAQAPGWVQAGDAIANDRAEAERKLSTTGFPLLFCPAPQRERAANLATWLRDQGLSSTRIRPATHDDGSLWYIVVSFVGSEAQAETDLARLRTLASDAPPAFEPEFVANVRALTGARHLNF